MDRTIIIFDDSPDDQEICTRELSLVKGINYDCYCTANDAFAMQLLQERKVDCLLLDYSLPGKNGLVLLAHIREAYPYLPVVMLTGHGSEMIAAEAMKLGAQDYILKSEINSDNLHAIINHAIMSCQGQEQITSQNKIINPAIVIIDDNEDDRDMYIRYLKQLSENHYAYIEASGGEEGIEAVKDKEADCVLLDYSLPGQNGIEVMKKIREIRHFLPVIILTGYGNEAIAVQAMREGAFNYLPKSRINPEMLLRAVRSAIDHGKMERQIHEQKMQIIQQKQELANFGHLMRAVLDSSAHMIVAINLKGIVTLFNPAAEQGLGYHAEEVIGKQTPLIWHDAEEMTARVETVREELQTTVAIEDLSLFTAKVLAQGKDSQEWTLVHKDGKKFPAIMTITPLYEDGHVLAGFLAVLEDISEQKEADEFKRQLIVKLMESNTELERFAYVASHDMQEPLRMVASFGKLIAEEYHSKLDADGQQYIGLITESAQRMQNMIHDLLEYARAGHDNSRPTSVDLEKELEHVLVNLTLVIEENNAVITHDPLPELQGNPIQIMRLLQNIINNAMKYQPPGNVPEVHISSEDRGTHWGITIRDNGIGVREEDQARIFEPFKRLHSWDQYQGSGVGLAVCKKIVENHGGKIWLVSEYGKGSSFCFTLAKQGVSNHAS